MHGGFTVLTFDGGDPPLGYIETLAGGRGPILTFTPAEWRAFIEGAKDGEFDLA